MKYSKMFGAIIGAVLGMAVAKFGLPAEVASPEVESALTLLVTAFATWLAPANKV